MKEKTVFALRAAPSPDTIHKTLSSDAQNFTTRFTSFKNRLVNGKVVSSTTLKVFVNTGDSTWLANPEITMGDKEVEISLHVLKNTTGSNRGVTLLYVQNESNYSIQIALTQEAGVTYTDVLELPLLSSLSVGSNKGSTGSIEVTAYSLGSDGSKVAKSPNVGNTPSWANQVSIGAGSAEHKYKITFTATETNTSTSIRNSPVSITCGTVTKTIRVSQRGQMAPPQFTLTGLPLNKSCYLFASGSKPQSGGSGSISGYFMIYGLDGQVTLNIPVKVNLSSYGNTTEADTGDEVTVWTSSGSNIASYIGRFIVPSAGETVSI